MKLLELESIIKEIIKESLFGQRLKIMIDGNLLPALISKNVLNAVGEGEYRLSWFDSKTKEPRGHLDFSEKTKDELLTTKQLPMALRIKCFKNSIPIPKLIFENNVEPSIQKKKERMRPGNHIIVGTIDPDDNSIVYRIGGAHTQLPVKNLNGDWRYNPDTEIVYWHENHPQSYNVLVEKWLMNKEFKVKNHLILDNIKNPIIYKSVWNDAHGIDNTENY